MSLWGLGGGKTVSWVSAMDWIKNNSTIRIDKERYDTEKKFYNLLKDGKVLCRLLGYHAKTEISGIVQR